MLIQGMLHKVLKRLPQQQLVLSLSQLRMETRPDIFISYEWVQSQLSEGLDYPNYATHANNRKAVTFEKLVHKYQTLQTSLDFEYQFLFHPLLVAHQGGGYIPINLHRCSILMALEKFPLPCKVLPEEQLSAIKLNPQTLESHYVKRIGRILGKDRQQAIMCRIEKFQS